MSVGGAHPRNFWTPAGASLDHAVAKVHRCSAALDLIATRVREITGRTDDLAHAAADLRGGVQAGRVAAPCVTAREAIRSQYLFGTPLTYVGLQCESVAHEGASGHGIARLYSTAPQVRSQRALGPGGSSPVPSLLFP